MTWSITCYLLNILELAVDFFIPCKKQYILKRNSLLNSLKFIYKICIYVETEPKDGIPGRAILLTKGGNTKSARKQVLYHVEKAGVSPCTVDRGFRCSFAYPGIPGLNCISSREIAGSLYYTILHCRTWGEGVRNDRYVAELL